MIEPKKSLGQHWLKDASVLKQIVDQADVNGDDTVLEIGPGPGGLTNELLSRGASVIAVEVDEYWASALDDHDRLLVVQQDIRRFDLGQLPPNYKVVANLPYYLTSYVLQLLTTADHQPSQITVLIQKEVAERIAASPGQLSILALAMQLFGRVQLGPTVAPRYFEPPPKVDSQVLTLIKHQTPLTDNDPAQVIKIIKLGFASKRKTLINNLASSLPLTKPQLKELMQQLDIAENVRAQELTIKQWDQLTTKLSSHNLQVTDAPKR